MQTSTFNYKYLFLFLLFAIVSQTKLVAQKDSAIALRRPPIDTSKQKLNMDAVYNRPFLSNSKIPIAIGGYLEANTHYEQTDGVSDGLSFQARRLTLFFSSTISKKIRFLSELEFEDGTKEINIEFAALDLEFHPMLNLRGGIVMNPIGAFNQNHDGPRWEFVDRPISATSIIPSTLANAGFGLHGKYFRHGWIFGYETYLTNGFNDNIISNSENRTSLAAGKLDIERFEESNSGLPMFTGKFAVRNRKIGELGLSCMHGVYNQWQSDGIVLDDKRTATAAAIDFNTSLFKNKLAITAEAAQVFVQVPVTYSQAFGNRQFGGYADLVYTLLQRKLLGWEKAKLNLSLRAEYVDYNMDKFAETNGNIADHLWSVMPSISFRPVGSTVLRLNYRHMQQTDLLGNPPAKTGAIQFGFSSYF